MCKRKINVPIIISVVLGIIFLSALIFSCFWIPVVTNSMIDVVDNIGNRNEISNLGRALIIADVYAMVAVAMAAVVLMFILLRVVYTGKVFTRTASNLLSAVSLCCFGEAFLLTLLVVSFQLVICLALAACFLGLSLRIVRHVIVEAIKIKCENDFTI